MTNISKPLIPTKSFSLPDDPTSMGTYNSAMESILNDLTNLFNGYDSTEEWIGSADTALQSEITKLKSAADSLYAKASPSLGCFQESDCNLLSDPALTVDTVGLVRPIALNVPKYGSVEIEDYVGEGYEISGVENLLDNRDDTFWQMDVSSSSIISADVGANPWLADTSYKGGAALCLKVSFQELTPISEISMNMLSDNPMDLIGLSYSTTETFNKDDDPVNIDGGDFASWNKVPQSSTIQTAYEGNDDSVCLKIGLNGSCSINKAVNFEQGGSYIITFFAKANGQAHIDMQLSCNYGKSNLFRKAEIPDGDYKQYTYLITLPAGVSDVPILTFTFSGSGTLWFDNLSASTCCESIIPDYEINGNKLVIPVSVSVGKPIMARTLWIKLAQRRYSLAGKIVSNQYAAASSMEVSSTPAASPIEKAAEGIGRLISDAFQNLTAIACGKGYTSESKYSYRFAASSIDIRYKDYLPAGKWLSKPVNIRGEIKSVTVNAEIGEIDKDCVNLYLMSGSSTYPIENNTRVTIGSDIIIDPTEVADIFNGTDRYNRVYLSEYPHVDYTDILSNKETYNPNVFTHQIDVTIEYDNIIALPATTAVISTEIFDQTADTGDTILTRTDSSTSGQSNYVFTDTAKTTVYKLKYPVKWGMPFKVTITKDGASTELDRTQYKIEWKNTKSGPIADTIIANVEGTISVDYAEGTPSAGNIPATYNRTDYLAGKIPVLRQAVLDKSSSDYYPVFEYYVDSSGYVIFANDFFEYGDTPAKITCKYRTIRFNPRLMIEYTPPVTTLSICRTPIVKSYTIDIKAR